MRAFVARLVVAATMALAAASASAQDWGNLATISSTLGVNANRMCIGEGLRASDIGCPSYAPYVSSSGFVGIGTAIPTAPLTFGTGYGTKINLGVASTVSMSIAVPDATTFQLNSNGEIKLNPGTGVFTFGGAMMSVNSNSSGIRLYSSTDATGLDIGTQKAALPTSAYIYTPQGAGVFPLNAWGDLILGAGTGRDVIVGRTSQIVVKNNGNVGIGGWVTPSVALEVSGTISATNFVGNGSGLTGVGGSPAGISGSIQFKSGSSFAGRSDIVIDSAGQVAIGTTNPSATLEISGTLKLAGGTGAEVCDPEHYGQIRRNPTTGAFQICASR